MEEMNDLDIIGELSLSKKKITWSRLSIMTKKELYSLSITNLLCRVQQKLMKILLNSEVTIINDYHKSLAIDEKYCVWMCVGGECSYLFIDIILLFVDIPLTGPKDIRVNRHNLAVNFLFLWLLQFPSSLFCNDLWTLDMVVALRCIHWAWDS